MNAAPTSGVFFFAPRGKIFDLFFARAVRGIWRAIRRNPYESDLSERAGTRAQYVGHRRRICTASIRSVQRCQSITTANKLNHVRGDFRELFALPDESV